MKVVLENERVLISDPSEKLRTHLRKALSYKDKSKEFQLRRMSKNPFTRNSEAYKQIEREMHGNLMEELPDGSIVVPSGFGYLFKDMNPDDRRTFNGASASYPWHNKPFPLREYQQEAVDLMLTEHRGLVNFATGLGKTLTAIYAVREVGKRALILCPGTSIADNFYKELCEAFGENKVGYFGNGKKKIKDITVGIAQSVNNHVDKFKKHDLGLIIIDEVHHVPANTFFNIASQLSSVGRIYGLTATDFRSDGKDVMITAGVGDVLIRRDLVWGVKSGWLADPYIIIREVPTTGREYREDKIKNYKEHVLNSKIMNERIVEDCRRFIAAGKSVLCLVNEVSHGQMISEKLGVPFATGTDKKSQEYVEQLNAGTIPGLVGTDSKIGEGTDTKRVDVLVLANFVAGKGPLWQNLGRGMRLYGNKKNVIVLDYIPAGSQMLTRHANTRIRLYKEITNNIKVC